MKEINERFALVNGRVVTPDTVKSGLAVVVEGTTIAGVVPVADLVDATPEIDVGGRLIAPGLLDMHTHGALGHTFNEPTAAAFGVIVRICHPEILRKRHCWRRQ